ncbi:alpha/beta hydrolase [Thalassovita sp.]|jgi:pimeloyl-ACP methyl ester carboxylesterase|uniref:alpha/beta hydrolase n=1 Tax=Thalassovita sp. TaxID=1979401 RepID=UPI003B5B3909
MRRLVFKLVLLAGIVLAVAAAASQAERFLFYPFDPRHVSPQDAGLSGVTETRLSTPDGETLIVWSAPPKGGMPVILYFHGNAGNLAVRAARFQRMMDQGFGLIAPAYRGSSGSTGTPSEETLIADAKLVAAHPGWPKSDKRAIYGESLGTAVAIALLAQGGNADALLLEAPLTSIQAMAQTHYPSLAPLTDKLRNQWPSLSRAQHLKLPMMIIHGTEDTLIPIEMGRQIHAAAPSKDKSFLAVKGAGHTDLWRNWTMTRMWRFLAR